ncbi:MAG: cytochrome P450, partial [Planktomarina sp.]
MAATLLTTLKKYPAVINFLIKHPKIHRRLNRGFISQYTAPIAPRPRPFSLRSDHTSWVSLNDRRYTGRQLPADHDHKPLPDFQETLDLWKRQGSNEIPSQDTSLLFAFFAQWLTDSFLRTDVEDIRRNKSNHEIDFCQLYGQTPEQTDILRSGVGGKMKTQTIKGEEYPPYLFDPEKMTPDNLVYASDEFAQLYDPKILGPIIKGFDPDRLKYMFATGLEHGNTQIGYTALSTVFLREHNRTCDLLTAAYPDWSDERLFDTARNITMVLYLNIILREYVAQVGVVTFPFDAEPGWPEQQRWYRNNWINVEFSLLYRWHSMVPELFCVKNQNLSVKEYRRNPQIVPELGVDAILTAASTQTAGKIGLQNTHHMFFEMFDGKAMSVQSQTLKMARDFKLRSMNDYREFFQLDRITEFTDLVDDPAMAAKLAEMYETPDDIEWIVGLFAEKHGTDEMMGDLMLHMVAYDAFTHALTNPLLSENIYSPETFSNVGMDIINTTGGLRDIVARNVPEPAGVIASFQSIRDIPGSTRFTRLGGLAETLDFIKRLGWAAYFDRKKSICGSTVFRGYALQPQTFILDAMGCEVFTNWDGRLRKETSFGIANAPSALTGGKTPTVFQNGPNHDAYKALYAQILSQRDGDLDKAFEKVFTRHTDRWTSAKSIRFSPCIEEFTMDFVFEWIFDLTLPTKDLTLVYNSIFGHKSWSMTQLNPKSDYHKSLKILSRIKPKLQSSPRFAAYTEMAKSHGLDDQDDLLEQLLFLVGMNSYLGLQSLLKSLIGELSNHKGHTDTLRTNLHASGPAAATPFITETLRLHPPVFFIHGVAEKDFVLTSKSGNFHIPKGERLTGVIPCVQRDAEVFDDPHLFNPDRPKSNSAAASMIWSHVHQDRA